MILDSITLQNFGLYAGRQTVELTPPSGDRPIVLFGGMNGGGKTTFLDALQLGFFGAHAKTSTRGSTAYRDYLSSSIFRAAARPEASIEISFRHIVEGNEDRYRLTRSWSRLNGNCKEAFSVEKNGKREDAVAQNWASQVDDFLPANIAHLFLFDGEQIERYASVEESCSLIGSGIQALLGLDMVDQLEQDLRVYERRKRTEVHDERTRGVIEAAERELQGLQSRLDELQQDRAALRTHQIDRHQRKLERIEAKYKRLGGPLFERRTEIERTLIVAKKILAEGEHALRELAIGPLPLFLVRDLLESALGRDRREEDSRRARELFDVLKIRDEEVLGLLRSESVDERLLGIVEKHFGVDLARRQVLGQRESKLNLAPSVRIDLQGLLQNGFDQLLVSSAQLLKAHQRGLHRLSTAMAESDSIPPSDVIAEVAAERDAIKTELAALEVQYEGMGEEIGRLAREKERKEQSLIGLIRNDEAGQNKLADRERILRHVDRVRSTLGEFRRVVVSRHVRRIERLVLESYQQLLRKDSLIDSLSIDPDSFAITIYARDGKGP